MRRGCWRRGLGWQGWDRLRGDGRVGGCRGADPGELAGVGVRVAGDGAGGGEPGRERSGGVLWTAVSPEAAFLFLAAAVIGSVPLILASTRGHASDCSGCYRRASL